MTISGKKSTLNAVKNYFEITEIFLCSPSSLQMFVSDQKLSQSTVVYV